MSEPEFQFTKIMTRWGNVWFEILERLALVTGINVLYRAVSSFYLLAIVVISYCFLGNSIYSLLPAFQAKWLQKWPRLQAIVSIALAGLLGGFSNLLASRIVEAMAAATKKV